MYVHSMYLNGPSRIKRIPIEFNLLHKDKNYLWVSIYLISHEQPILLDTVRLLETL